MTNNQNSDFDKLDQALQEIFLKSNKKLIRIFYKNTPIKFPSGKTVWKSEGYARSSLCNWAKYYLREYAFRIKNLRYDDANFKEKWKQYEKEFYNYLYSVVEFREVNE